MSDLFLVRPPERDASSWCWRRLGPAAEAPATVQYGDDDAARQALEGQRVVTVLPGRHLSWHRLDLPLKGARLLAAAPYALEDALAEDIDGLHFSPAPAPLGSRAVFVVQKHWLEEQIARIEALEPGEVVAAVPDFALLPVNAPGGIVLASDGTRAWLRDVSGTLLEVPVDLLQQHTDLDADAPVHFVSIGGAPLPCDLTLQQRSDWDDLLSADVSLSSLRAYSLLHGEFSRQSRQFDLVRPFLWPAAALAAVIVVHAAISGLVLWKFQQENAAVRAQVETTFRETFPHITRIVDMRVQAQQQLEQAQRGSDVSPVLALLAKSADALTQTPELQLDNVQFRDAALYLSLSGKSLQALEALRGKLESQPELRLEVQSAQAGSDGVQIRLKLEHA